jgi:hypothetical protein
MRRAVRRTDKNSRVGEGRIQCSIRLRGRNGARLSDPGLRCRDLGLPTLSRGKGAVTKECRNCYKGLTQRSRAVRRRCLPVPRRLKASANLGRWVVRNTKSVWSSTATITEPQIGKAPPPGNPMRRFQLPLLGSDQDSPDPESPSHGNSIWQLAGDWPLDEHRCPLS